MKYKMEEALEVLERTPLVLKTLLESIGEPWFSARETSKSWTPYDVVGHLIHGEKSDWLLRAKIILSQSENRKFEAFDREAQFRDSVGQSLGDLLSSFASLRKANIAELRSLKIETGQLKLEGEHPHFGVVTLGQLLSTWVVHDLGHIAQISRAMASNYKEEVGPWKEYLPVLRP